MRRIAILALLCSATTFLCAQVDNVASDRIVVVGNIAQPVAWNHRNTIQDAINKAQPNGTVIVPTTYIGTDCNPVSICNPGSVNVIDWRQPGGANFAAPPPLGNLTPNSVNATTVSSTQQLSAGTSGQPGQQSFYFVPDVGGVCAYHAGFNSPLDELNDVFGALMWNPQGSAGTCQQLLGFVPLPGTSVPNGGQTIGWVTNQGWTVGAQLSPITFLNGLGSVNHLTGPSDQPFVLATQNNQNLYLKPGGTGNVQLSNPLTSSSTASFGALTVTGLGAGAKQMVQGAPLPPCPTNTPNCLQANATGFYAPATIATSHWYVPPAAANTTAGYWSVAGSSTDAQGNTINVLSVSNNGISFPAALVTTSGTSDNVTVAGMTSSGHCSLTATNAAAATNIATTYVSAKTTNQITVTHTGTANMNYDILCTPN